jgi:hypothetical protein
MYGWRKSCGIQGDAKSHQICPGHQIVLLKLPPKHESEERDLVSYCESDWSGDPESRISVTGFIIYFLGVPIFGDLRLRRELHCPVVKLSTWLCRKQ